MGTRQVESCLLDCHAQAIVRIVRRKGHASAHPTPTHSRTEVTAATVLLGNPNMGVKLGEEEDDYEEDLEIVSLSGIDALADNQLPKFHQPVKTTCFRTSAKNRLSMRTSHR